jgi:DNA-binding SARP family transcriptional activator
MGWVPQARGGRRPKLAFADGALALDVLNRHPYAILVEDRQGRLVGYNRAAARTLDGWAPLAAGGEIGCDLLGCRQPGGPREDTCLHERAREHHGPLPEMRIDLPASAAIEAAWVMVAALEPDRELIVTELRPGRLGDRRRRSEPDWTAGPQLRIFALGRTRVRSAETPLDGRWLDNRPGQILKFLVAERHRRAHSDEIIDQLWPTGTHDTRGLRNFIHVLREQLEPEGTPNPPSSFVLSTPGGYTLDQTRVWIDADAFEELVEAGVAAADRGDDAAALDCLRRGVALYRGHFLADEPYAEWTLLERDRLRRLASDGLQQLAMLDERQGDLAAAAVSLGRLADLEPYDVDVHRDLLIVLLRTGRRSEALRRYETLRRRMQSTFAEQLDFTLADLAPSV